jgi:hypothetical protein
LVINEAMETYFPNQDPIGNTLAVMGYDFRIMDERLSEVET